MKTIKIQAILQQLSMSLYGLNSNLQGCPIKKQHVIPSRSEESPAVGTVQHTTF